ncbi:hypothetical protein GPECTOR_376g168 [Gonium pectorale]|uniref:Uncharacterized protein n=1 Tax=Gonium pectorale TaxID=33097 RepID=A0A150FVE3_GONPE|nr:hypothetical protein GPECTOR_376g168 [Gonium pectorale]|eukprot:KXZ41591.1 hypothetical protein GPECTOR_376g168 [Gonium pectorale]
MAEGPGQLGNGRVARVDGAGPRLLRPAARCHEERGARIRALVLVIAASCALLPLLAIPSAAQSTASALFTSAALAAAGGDASAPAVTAASGSGGGGAKVIPTAYVDGGGYGPPVELNPSVMILGEFDWVPYQSKPPFTSRCTDMVDRSKRNAGGSRINFVPTHYWRDRNQDGGVDAYCYMDSDMDCITHTAASIASFRAGMELCFRRAVEEGLGISIVPHLDDGGKTAAWRNGLLFDPKKKYNGFSYQQVMLDPIADALAAALAAKPSWVGPIPVWFALQGEMSATVIHHPNEYKALLSEMRQKLFRGMAAAGASEELVSVTRRLTQVGVSFNFNKVMQINTGGGAGGGSEASVLARFRGFGPFTTAINSLRGLRAVVTGVADGAVAAVGGGGGVDGGAGARRRLLAPQVDVGALKSLFEAIDFLGISAYAALDAADFPSSVRGVGSGGKALQNAAFTFFGEMKAELGIDVPAILARRKIDLHYSEFGLGGGASMGSWDVLGIYPESTTPAGSYRDPAVVAAVKRHNDAIVAATTAAAALAAARGASMPTTLLPFSDSGGK